MGGVESATAQYAWHRRQCHASLGVAPSSLRSNRTIVFTTQDGQGGEAETALETEATASSFPSRTKTLDELRGTGSTSGRFSRLKIEDSLLTVCPYSSSDSSLTVGAAEGSHAVLSPRAAECQENG